MRSGVQLRPPAHRSFLRHISTAAQPTATILCPGLLRQVNLSVALKRPNPPLPSLNPCPRDDSPYITPPRDAATQCYSSVTTTEHLLINARPPKLTHAVAHSVEVCIRLDATRLTATNSHPNIHATPSGSRSPLSHHTTSFSRRHTGIHLTSLGRRTSARSLHPCGPSSL